MSDGRVLDPESWVDQYGDYLYRYAVSRLRDPTAAEEVLQETFLAGVLDDTNHDVYATRIELAAGVSWLTLILGNRHGRSS